MASGFNGQNFAFVGYLPVDKVQRAKRIKELEQLSSKYKQAQFFIETPYRNDQMFDTLISTLQPSSQLYIGVNITDENQKLSAFSVYEWKKRSKPTLHKVPVVFGIYC